MANNGVARLMIGTGAALPPTNGGRRFGELLVDDKVITREQLDAALRLQAVSQTYVPLGQVLIAAKLVTRKQLAALLQRHKKRSRLGEILHRTGRVTTAQLEDALALQRWSRIPIGQALIRLGFITETMLRDALCTQLHINFFDLEPIPPDQRLVRLIGERFATRHGIVPLFRVDDTLVIAMDDPTQVALVENLETTLHLHVELVTATSEQIRAAIRRLYGPATPPDVNPHRRRNVLIGPLRDLVVAALVDKGLQGACILPAGWQ
jgi:hypothetical protein